jgi:hypothetical protein
MKNKIMLLSAFVVSIGTSFAQNNLPVLPLKNTAAETPVLEAIDFKPDNSNTIVTPKGGSVWYDGFEDANNWIAAGPAGANPPEFGWSIGATTNSWAGTGTIQTTMNTSGSFARFRNGTTTTAVADGPFTFTYNGTIDLTDVPVPHLEFKQYGARFITLHAVQISLDGNTWTTVIDNNDIAPLTSTGGSAFPRPMDRRVNLAPFLSGDISEVRVRLFWNGALNGTTMNYIDYGWYVDDIMIVPGDENDMTLNRRFAYLTGNLGYMHTKVPVSQVPSNGSLKIEFRADVTNNGTETQNAYLNATSGSYSGDGTPKSIVSSQNDSLFITGTPAFTVPATVGVYNFTLTVESDNTLTNTGDDVATFPFEVTPAVGGVMASDFYNGTPASMTGGFTGWADASGDPSIGTWFEAFQTSSGSNSIGAVDVGIANIAAANQGPFIGNTIYAQIWRVVAGELVFAGITAEYELKAADFGKTIRLYFDENCINVNAGDDLAVMASFSDAAPVPVAFAGESLAGTTIGMDGGSFIGLAPTVPGGPYVRVPVVRPVFTCFVGLENETINESEVSVYPNPASESANVQMTLNGEEQVVIVIRDLAGKTIQTINAGKLTTGAHNISMNLEGVAQGMYTVTISAGTSTITQKMIVK